MRQPLSLELAHTVPRDAEPLHHLLERLRLFLVPQPVAQLEHPPFLLGESRESATQSLLSEAQLHLFGGLRGAAFEQLSERRLAALADWLVEARDGARDRLHVADLLERHLRRLRD